jgi:hypothetical protein
MKRFRGLSLLSLAVIVLLFVPGCGATPKADGTVQPSPTPKADGTVQPSPTPKADGTVQLSPTPPPTEGSAPSGTEILAPGVWKCPDDLTGALFFGSTEGETYYLPDCSQVDKIEDEHRICFATSDAARAYGYTPCGRCP